MVEGPQYSSLGPDKIHDASGGLGRGRRCEEERPGREDALRLEQGLQIGVTLFLRGISFLSQFHMRGIRDKSQKLGI